MRKKKKGSSFVIVVIIMAVLFTLGTSMLTVTASDYKMRINESNKLKNLYGADSGLDIVEEIIIITSQQAISYADKKVKENLLSLEDKSKSNLNKLFKENYMKFMYKVPNEDNVDNKEVLEYLINNKKYIKSVDKNGSFNEYIDIANNASINVKDYSKNINENEIIITVESTFETEEGEFKNKKTVQTKFTIIAPEYESVVDDSKVTEKIDIYPVFDEKIITADGNLDINGKSEVEGDVWIKGNSQLKVEENPAFTFDKYKGGIAVDNGSFKLKGNIFTASNLSLKDKATTEITGDVYALNAYVGKSVKGESSENNSLTITNNLVVNNDLALNAKKSSINIGNDFYGINDKTKFDATTGEKALKSSSIIINEVDGSSSITVKKDSYIMGVSYIDATNNDGNKYQTAESVAVKGNYLAYTSIIDGYEERVNLKYYNPLHLIESIDKDNSVEKKAQYFNEYYKTNKEELNSAGISLNNVYSVGAYIKKGDTYVGGITEENQRSVNNKRGEFATNVFSMGDRTGISESVDIYNDGKVLKTVENQISFDEIKGNEELNEKFGKVFLSKDKDIVISKDKIKVGDVDYIIKDAEIKALIITGGNVIIEGDVNFKGNIIAKGNVVFNEAGIKKLYYDEDLTRKIIASNYDVLKNIFFVENGKKQEVIVDIGNQVNVDNSTSVYEKDSYLKTGYWKIVK